MKAFQSQKKEEKGGVITSQNQTFHRENRTWKCLLREVIRVRCILWFIKATSYKVWNIIGLTDKSCIVRSPTYDAESLYIETLPPDREAAALISAVESCTDEEFRRLALNGDWGRVLTGGNSNSRNCPIIGCRSHVTLPTFSVVVKTGGPQSKMVSFRANHEVGNNLWARRSFKSMSSGPSV